MAQLNVVREKKLINELISYYDLKLSGLTVLTELASGAYRNNFLAAAKAGADVIAVVADSRFGKAVDIEAEAISMMQELGVEKKVKIVKSKDEIDFSIIDIVTNTGFVRPINAEVIKSLKATAVIPLMWETWEYREGEVDLAQCKYNDILCLGTDESHEKLFMDNYVGILAIKLLLELSLEVYKTHLILIGSNKFSERIYNFLNHVGAIVHWFSYDERDHPRAEPLANLPKFFEDNANKLDGILISELTHAFPIISDKGVLSPSHIKRVAPHICIGILAGLIDVKELERVELIFKPEIIAPPHYLSYQLYDVGPKPVIELFAAGLKVGEAMARARLAGMSIKDATRFALQHSPAMDFPGKLAWL